MAKTSLINKNLKRKELINRYRDKRKKLKEMIKNKKITVEERLQIQFKLNKKRKIE